MRKCVEMAFNFRGRKRQKIKKNVGLISHSEELKVPIFLVLFLSMLLYVSFGHTSRFFLKMYFKDNRFTEF